MSDTNDDNVPAVPIEAQRQAVTAFLAGATAVLDVTLATLRRTDPEAWLAASRLTAAGAMLSARLTTSQAGLLHVAVDLHLPTGADERLLDMDLTSITEGRAPWH